MCVCVAAARRALGCAANTSSARFWFDLRQHTRFLSTPFIAAPLSLVFIVWAGPSAAWTPARPPASICKHSIWHQTNTKIGIHTRLAAAVSAFRLSCDTQKIPSVAAAESQKRFVERKGKLLSCTTCPPRRNSLNFSLWLQSNSTNASAFYLLTFREKELF